MTFKKLSTTLSGLIIIGFLVISCNSSSTTETKENPSETAVIDDGERKLDKETFAAAIKKSGAVTVDVRMPGEFEQGHIEGAININFFDPEFKYKLLELNKNKKYYLYCKNETRSYRSMKFMEDNGFKNVYMLEGGYEDWNTAKAE
jgi:rhodanese-related sulfurtransferase